MKGWGPPAGACACWHLKHADGPCTFQGCGCPRSRWSWSLVDVVRVPLRFLRGW